MTAVKLTAKQTALMADIATQQFSFFDDGLVAGSGIWMDVLTGECGTDIAANAKGAATVTSSVAKKGLLETSGDPRKSSESGEGVWVALTEAGAEWCREYLAAQEASPVIQEELPVPAEEAPEEAPVIQEAPATPAPAKKARKTKKAAAEAAPVIQEAPAAPEEDPGYEVKEWSEDLAPEEGGYTEFIETTFPDGSLTLRRRRKVSGAWRTDFWGVDAAGKRYFILSRDAKAARTAGKYVAPEKQA